MPIPSRRRQRAEELAQDVLRYSETGHAGGTLRRLARRMRGSIEPLINMVLGTSLHTGRQREVDLSNLDQIIQDSMSTGRTPPPVDTGAPPIQGGDLPGFRTRSVANYIDDPEKPNQNLMNGGPDPEEGIINTRQVGGHWIGHESIKEIETPYSSNVYSIAYDDSVGILYVTFKAPGPGSDPKTMTSVCSGVQHTVYSRPHERGPTYAYGSVAAPIPPWMFRSLRDASSKGQWIWKHLRGCHQGGGPYGGSLVPYTLSSPSISENGEVYVPRKEVGPGQFRVRSVSTVDRTGKTKETYVSTILTNQRERKEAKELMRRIRRYRTS